MLGLFLLFSQEGLWPLFPAYAFWPLLYQKLHETTTLLFLAWKEFLIFHLDPAPAPALGPSSQIVAEFDEKTRILLVRWLSG